jgi:hypothetical protein
MDSEQKTIDTLLSPLIEEQKLNKTLRPLKGGFRRSISCSRKRGRELFFRSLWVVLVTVASIPPKRVAIPHIQLSPPNSLPRCNLVLRVSGSGVVGGRFH